MFTTSTRPNIAPVKATATTYWLARRRKRDGEILAAIGVVYLVLMMGVFAWYAYRTGKRQTAQDLMEREKRRRR